MRFDLLVRSHPPRPPLCQRCGPFRRLRLSFIVNSEKKISIPIHSHICCEEKSSCKEKSAILHIVQRTSHFLHAQILLLEMVVDQAKMFKERKIEMTESTTASHSVQLCNQFSLLNIKFYLLPHNCHIPFFFTFGILMRVTFDCFSHSF